MVILTQWYAVLGDNSEFVFRIRLDLSIYFELFFWIWISTNSFNVFSALSTIEFEAVAVFPSPKYLCHIWDTVFLFRLSTVNCNKLYLCWCLLLSLGLSELSYLLTVDSNLDWLGSDLVSLLLSWGCLSRSSFLKNSSLHNFWAY